MEAAAGWVERYRRHDAGDFLQALAAAKRAFAEAGQRVDQALRVGMARGGEDRIGRLGLDDAAGIHYRHAPAHVGDQAQVVADHQHGGALGGAELGHQVDDLGLHRDVERRRGFVGDQKVGAAGQRNGDHDALAHAAGKLVRIVADAPLRRGHADLAQRFLGAVHRFVPAGALVQHEHLGDLLADRRQWIERRHRLLEDHGDAFAPQRPQLGGRGVLDLLAVEHDPAAAERQRPAQQAHQGERGDGLAATRFTNEAEGLAAADLEGHAFDGVIGPVFARQRDAEVFDLQERCRHPRLVVDCGSRMSRRPSPRRLRPSTVRKMARPGNTESQGAVLIWSRASESMLPQLG